MTFKFIHTADWQIGKPFGMFPPEKAVLLRRARLDAIGRLAAAARAGGTKHVLVAGDVFESGDAADMLVRSVVARLAQHPAIVWHLLPGNHDPARLGGLWDWIRKIGKPTNVIVHDNPEPYEAEPGIFILPSPLKSRSLSDDPTSWMDRAATPPGSIRIGLAHGSVQGFGGSGESSVLISASRPATAGLSYLALGDWHGKLRISDRVWYSGTPEPDRYPSNEPGHALLVSIDGAQSPPQVESISTAQYTWVRRTLAVRQTGDLKAFESEVASLGEEAGRLLVSLDLEGTIPAIDVASISKRLDTLEPALFHLDRSVTRLRIFAGENDIEALGTGDLRLAGEKLRALAAGPAGPRARIAEAALGRLFELANKAEDSA